MKPTQEVLPLIPDRGDPATHSQEELIYRNQFRDYLNQGLLRFANLGKLSGLDKELLLELAQYLGTKGGVIMIHRVSLRRGKSVATQKKAWAEIWKEFSQDYKPHVNKGLTGFEHLISLVDWGTLYASYAAPRSACILREATDRELKIGRAFFNWLGTDQGQMFIEVGELKCQAARLDRQFIHHSKYNMQLGA